MRIFKSYSIVNPDSFKTLLLGWAQQFSEVCYMDANNYKNDKYSEFDFLLAAKAVNENIFDKEKYCNKSFEALEELVKTENDWLFGHLSYDLKNETEDLISSNEDNIHFPQAYFFKPALMFICNGNKLSIGYLDDYYQEKEIESLIIEINNFIVNDHRPSNNIDIKAKVNRSEYISTVNKIKNHIQLGDIYEMNYCQEFFATNANINPYITFEKLNQLSPSPFACYYKLGPKHLLCCSPERYLKKQDSKLISQPIKGTIKRGKNEEEDEQLKNTLRNDPKEQSENVMIVDLVRNDLARTAKTKTVEVEELFGIYTFKNVHQMISTIVSEIDEQYTFGDALRLSFPMGSMTGAPKVSAMKIIEKYENTKRGLYSGSVGYISPNAQKFDFNVVIRSVLYNAQNNYLSFEAGGAITIKSVPEKEYEECMIKARHIFEVLK